MRNDVRVVRAWPWPWCRCSSSAARSSRRRDPAIDRQRWRGRVSPASRQRDRRADRDGRAPRPPSPPRPRSRPRPPSPAETAEPTETAEPGDDNGVDARAPTTTTARTAATMAPRTDRARPTTPATRAAMTAAGTQPRRPSRPTTTAVMSGDGPSATPSRPMTTAATAVATTVGLVAVTTDRRTIQAASGGRTNAPSMVRLDLAHTGASRSSASGPGVHPAARSRLIVNAAASASSEDQRDDRAIVDAVLGGDRDAYRHLVERESASVVRSCHRVLGDLHEAEDAAQEAFVTAYRSLAGWRGDGPFGAWLTRIAVRIAVRQASKRRSVAWLEPADPADERPIRTATARSRWRRGRGQTRRCSPFAPSVRRTCAAPWRSSPSRIERSSRSGSSASSRSRRSPARPIDRCRRSRPISVGASFDFGAPSSPERTGERPRRAVRPVRAAHPGIRAREPEPPMPSWRTRWHRARARIARGRRCGPAGRRVRRPGHGRDRPRAGAPTGRPPSVGRARGAGRRVPRRPRRSLAGRLDRRPAHRDPRPGPRVRPPRHPRRGRADDGHRGRSRGPPGGQRAGNPAAQAGSDGRTDLIPETAEPSESPAASDSPGPSESPEPTETAEAPGSPDPTATPKSAGTPAPRARLARRRRRTPRTPRSLARRPSDRDRRPRRRARWSRARLAPKARSWQLMPTRGPLLTGTLNR